MAFTGTCSFPSSAALQIHPGSEGGGGPRPWFSNLSASMEEISLPGNPSYHIAGPTPAEVDFRGLGWGGRLCISNQFLGDCGSGDPACRSPALNVSPWPSGLLPQEPHPLSWLTEPWFGSVSWRPVLQGHLVLARVSAGQGERHFLWPVVGAGRWDLGDGGVSRNLSDSIKGTPSQADFFPASGHHCLRTSLRTSIIILGPWGQRPKRPGCALTAEKEMGGGRRLRQGSCSQWRPPGGASPCAVCSNEHTCRLGHF